MKLFNKCKILSFNLFFRPLNLFYTHAETQLFNFFFDYLINFRMF